VQVLRGRLAINLPIVSWICWVFGSLSHAKKV
jgi:hypothetical protein